MLRVKLPEAEYYDESENEFINVKSCALTLEHSLVSIAKWEAKWHKPFLSKERKTTEELYDYIRCMTLTQNVDPNVYRFIPKDVITKISDYIEDPMTATRFSEDKKSGSREIITSELVYYYMIANNVPMECQKWHFNRLMTLLRICAIKNQPSKKMSVKSICRQNAAINAARRARIGSKG